MRRRDFLKLISFGAAGCIFAPEAVAGIKKNAPKAGAVVVRDPHPGPVFKDPEEVSYIKKGGGIVEVELETKRASTSLRSKSVNVMTYNGLFPAPTIRVRKGDLLRLRLKNSFPPTQEKNVLGRIRNHTNLHTHGWHVSPSGNSDNIFMSIAPGEEFLYEYDTSKQEAGTLSYYHPHLHELVAEQMWAGHAGLLVVEDETPVLSDFETHLFLIKDISISGSEPEPHTMDDYIKGKEGDIILVNGQENPVLTIRPGQVQRWRIVNASTARYYNLSLEGHAIHLVGTDGGLLDRPYPLERLLLVPGERIDILVWAHRPGTYRLLSMPYDRKGNIAEMVTIMTLSCEGPPAEDMIPSEINPRARKPDVKTEGLKKRKINLVMSEGRGLINMKDFNTDPYVISSKVDTYEVWEIVNVSPMDHPFHQHTNPCRILDIKGGDPDYAYLYSSIPAWKDTFNVPYLGSATILVPVKDFTGKAVFHCHILQHEDIGMMGVWEIE